ncbi:MAG: hypothetical protein V4463_10480, partial [Pseudomonadota bacterium]
MFDAIDHLIHDFFKQFDNRTTGACPLDQLERFFADGAVIVKRSAQGVEVMSVEAFAAPRRRLLGEGTLKDFHEWEVSAETFCFGGTATRTSHYRKRGRLNGQAFEGEGMKSVQLVLTDAGWRITAIIWEDCSEALALHAGQRRVTTMGPSRQNVLTYQPQATRITL